MERKLGEVFLIDKEAYRVESRTGRDSCENCAFSHVYTDEGKSICNTNHHLRGACQAPNRNDKISVKFVHIGTLHKLNTTLHTPRYIGTLYDTQWKGGWVRSNRIIRIESVPAIATGESTFIEREVIIGDVVVSKDGMNQPKIYICCNRDSHNAFWHILDEKIPFNAKQDVERNQQDVSFDQKVFW